MLQIATGRLFTRKPGTTNNLRGTFYTNAVFPYETIEVPVANGRLLPPSSTRPGVKAVAYEFVERIEVEPDGRRSVIVSSTALPYTLDFATVCSFALNCICSPDYTLVQRLTSTQPGVVTGWPQGRFVKRTYDPEFFLQQAEVESLQQFEAQLIGLPRVKFLGAMRAIRTYVTALHRVADDLELAYTLLVASVESLAQEFDGHTAEWHSLEDRKRDAMDRALDGAPEDVAQRVREALLSNEHVALARRFREFTLAHTRPEYFRTEATNVELPAGRYDIEDCLREAYTLRSKYVHALKPLPHLLTVGHTTGEVVGDGNKNYFTISGLARLMRHVIVSFVMRQETVEHEVYDYRLERHGVGLYPLSPEMWVGVAEGDITGAGRDKLQGFLQQLTRVMLRAQGASLTDMRAVLNAANDFVPGITRAVRRPYLALMSLWNTHVSEEFVVQPSARVERLMLEELGLPCAEALVAYCLTERQPPWTLAQHREVLEAYFRGRIRNGLRTTRLIEAALTLDLAERFRAAGDFDEFRRLIYLAAEIEPGHARLATLEASLNNCEPVFWKAVLLPAPEPDVVEARPAPACPELAQEPAGAPHVVERPAQVSRTGLAARLARWLRSLAARIES